jgi:hypothetical protein
MRSPRGSEAAATPRPKRKQDGGPTANADAEAKPHAATANDWGRPKVSHRREVRRLHTHTPPPHKTRAHVADGDTHTHARVTDLLRRTRQRIAYEGMYDDMKALKGDLKKRNTCVADS